MALEDFDPTKGQELLDRAGQIAQSHDHEYVTLEHLLAAIIQDKEVIEILSELGANVGAISTDLLTHFNAGVLGKANGSSPRQTINLARVVQRTISQVIFSPRHSIRPVDFLIGLI